MLGYAMFVNAVVHRFTIFKRGFGTKLSPAVEFWVKLHGINVAGVKGTGPKGSNILKGDVIEYLNAQTSKPHSNLACNYDGYHTFIFPLEIYNKSLLIKIIDKLFKPDQQLEREITILSASTHQLVSLPFGATSKLHFVIINDFHSNTTAKENKLVLYVPNKFISEEVIGSIEKFQCALLNPKNILFTLM